MNLIFLIISLSSFVNSAWVDWDGTKLKSGDQIRLIAQYDSNYEPPNLLSDIVYLCSSPDWSYWGANVIAGTTDVNNVNKPITFQLTADPTDYNFYGPNPYVEYNTHGMLVYLSVVGDGGKNVNPMSGIRGVLKTGYDAAGPLIFADRTYNGQMTLTAPFIWLVRVDGSYTYGCTSGKDLLQCNQPTGHFGWPTYSMANSAKYKVQVQGSGCIPKIGTDWYGNDITSVTTASANDCGTQCLGLPGCLCYSWSTTSSTCYLKRTCTSGGGANSLINAGLCPTVSNSACISIPNTDFSGNDITSLPRNSPTDCAAACLATPGCQCTAWDSSGSNTCWLKSSCWGTGQPHSARQSSWCPLTISPCISKPNTDWAGNDINIQYTTSSEECGNRCKNFPGCTCYAWDSSGSYTCWLKSICSGTGSSTTIRQSGFCSKDSSQQCTIVTNTDFPNNDITSFTTPSPTACAAACQANSQCTCYGWDSSGSNTCWLKTICSGAGNAHSGRQSGFCPKGVQTYSYCSSTSNTDWSGNDLTTVITSSQLDCSIACQKNSGCQCYGWDSSGSNTCWLKSVCSGAGASTSNRQSGFCPKATTYCTAQPGLLWSGNDITQTVTMSAAECSVSCQNNAGCTCFTYSPIGNICKLKSSCSGSGTPDSTSQSGWCPK